MRRNTNMYPKKVSWSDAHLTDRLELESSIGFKRHYSQGDLESGTVTGGGI